MFALFLVTICIFGGALGQIALKKGMNDIQEISSFEELFNPGTLKDIITNPFVIGGVILYAILAFLWLGALSSLNVSYMYPLLSLAYIVTAVFAFFLLEEKIEYTRWIGIICIVIGCFFVTQS